LYFAIQVALVIVMEPTSSRNTARGRYLEK